MAGGIFFDEFEVSTEKNIGQPSDSHRQIAPLAYIKGCIPLRCLSELVRCFHTHFTMFREPIPNRSLDRYSAICYREYNFLPSFIFLLASCFSFVLAVARYAFELTRNNLLNNQIKSI